MFAVSRPPVLILGAHRAGTSAVTERLAAMGLFVGSRRDTHAESTFFQRLNRSLTSEAGGHWTTPGVVVETLGNVSELDRFSEAIRGYLTGPAAIEYWGFRSAARRSANPWGWKDPRNTYLAPLWAAVYPDVKIISIRRDPRACALSLHDRTTTLHQQLRHDAGVDGNRSRLGAQLRAIRGRPLVADGWRTATIAGALDVALEYGEIQARLSEAHEGVHTVDYEELIESPGPVLGAAAAFSGLTPTASLLREQAASIVPTKNSASAPHVDATAPQRRRLAALGYQTGSTSPSA